MCPQNFCDVMIKVGRDNGMQIAQPCYVKYLRENEIQSVCEEIKAKAGGNPIDLVYCILPRVSVEILFLLGFLIVIVRI